MGSFTFWVATFFVRVHNVDSGIEQNQQSLSFPDPESTNLVNINLESTILVTVCVVISCPVVSAVLNITICWFWSTLEATICTVDPFCWQLKDFMIFFLGQKNESKDGSTDKVSVCWHEHNGNTNVAGGCEGGRSPFWGVPPGGSCLQVGPCVAKQLCSITSWQSENLTAD